MVNQLVYSKTNVFKFDRCTGWLSDMKEFDSYNRLFSVASAFYIDISPDGTKLYTSTGYEVMQWDLEAADITASLDTIYNWDGFVDTMNVYPTYGVPHIPCVPQMAPDGTMWWSGCWVSRFYSTIDKPNLKGVDCEFRQRSVVLPKANFKCVNSAPNYRLGPLLGSECDTIFTSIKPLYTNAPQLSVYPNPAVMEVQIDYNFVEWYKYKNCVLKFKNSNGEIVKEVSLPHYSVYQKVDISSLSGGIYIVQLMADGKQLAVCKLIKEVK